jgi:hypothetical protein
MIELEQLRDAMESPPDFVPIVLDLDRVMVAGGRIRRRRRAATAAASGVAVVTLLVVGSQLTNSGNHPATDAAAAGPVPSGLAPSGLAPSGLAPSGLVPSGLMPSAVNSSAPGILGTVVETDRWVNDRQWIIYAETTDPDRLNETMTLVLGRTKTGYINDYSADVIGSDAGDARMSPGFHAVRTSRVVDGWTTPTFGYYTGDAARISARNTVTGKTVDAHLTAWTGFGPHDKAQIFWFDFDQFHPPVTLTDFTAYDSNGDKLHAGG